MKCVAIQLRAVFQIPITKRIAAPSPIMHLKAAKNPVEIKGMRNAHLKDAVALCDFLALLEKEVSVSFMVPTAYITTCTTINITSTIIIIIIIIIITIITIVLSLPLLLPLLLSLSLLLPLCHHYHYHYRYYYHYHYH